MTRNFSDRTTATAFIFMSLFTTNGLSIQVAFAGPTSITGADKKTVSGSKSDTTSLKTSTANSDKSKAANAHIGTSATVTTATVKRQLQGGVAKAGKQKPIVQKRQVLGNGLTPDPYIPNTPYRPSPPANQTIRPVESNSR